MEATRKRTSPVPETEEQKKARMDKRNEGDRYRRKAETEEQKKARLEKRRERDRAKRRGEFNLIGLLLFCLLFLISILFLKPNIRTLNTFKH